VSLFLLKRVSVTFLATYTGAVALATIWHAFSTKWLEVVGMKGLSFAGGGFLVFVMFTHYARTLKAKGILR